MFRWLTRLGLAWLAARITSELAKPSPTRTAATRKPRSAPKRAKQ